MKLSVPLSHGRTGIPPAPGCVPAKASVQPAASTMLVVEDPLIGDMPVEYGTLVVIALDPLVSVIGLEDEQATKEAAALKPTKYLALVDNVRCLGPLLSVLRY